MFHTWFSQMWSLSDWTYLRPGRRVPFCWRRRLRQSLRRVDVMICTPSVNSWGRADRALGQHAVSLQLHYWLGNMVALFGSELSVFSSSVLFYADEKSYYFLHQVLLIDMTPFSDINIDPFKQTELTLNQKVNWEKRFWVLFVFTLSVHLKEDWVLFLVHFMGLSPLSIHINAVFG